jgi:ATP-dependent DNA helicase RecQ
MNMDPAALHTLKTTFGFDQFRPGQAEVVDHLLAGRSALAVFPTGGGKSLCYQLPALLLEGLTLVVSPLIALMKDQLDFLTRKGVPAARLDSSQGAEQTRQVWEDLASGRLRLLYIAPERFASERFLQQMRRVRIGMMVIDEAHCISEWGHNFRPDYMKLAGLARELGAERVLTLTATATPAVAEDIRRSFNIPEAAYVNTGFHRPNLHCQVSAVSPAKRNALLLERLRRRPPGATIVYVTLQKTAEDVADALKQAGIPAEAYHAGMDPDERHAVQDRFMSSPHSVVVATIAFGMGIDKSDIRYVYHYNPPKSLENYMQETGRAGRDGKPSLCEMLFCSEDIPSLENFSYGDTPSLESLQSLLAELLALPDRFDISTYDLSGRHDIQLLVVSTLLTYLELDGILASTGPLYSEYMFQPLLSAKDILARFDAEREAFLRNIFAAASKGRTWFTLDMDSATRTLAEPRARIVSALNYLEEKGDITLKVAGLRHGFRFLKRPPSPDDLCRSLHDRFRRAERRDLARIRQVIDLASSPECRIGILLRHFGETPSGPCGHCDRCDGSATAFPASSLPATLPPAALRSVQAVKQEKHPALQTPRQIARFLCGIRSPATTKAKLQRDPRFGELAHLPFILVAKAAAS